MSVSASNYARIDGDKYFTPAWVTEALLSVERFAQVWDPAGGDGGIITAMPANIRCWASDIAPDSEYVVERDFFDCPDAGGYDIITNPPYGIQSRLAVRFIEHALALTERHGGKVAMLLKVGFDSAGGRRHLFADHPAFAAEYRLTKRIRWTNLPQSDAGPTENHSWMVWDWRHRGGPAVKGYLPLKEAADATR
jgi:hypothetical protein